MHVPSLAVAAFVALFAAAASNSPERVIAGNGMVSGTVNGVALRLRVDPGVTAIPLITRQAAERAGLKPGLFGAEYAVGPVTVMLESAVTMLDTGTGPVRRRVAWTDRSWNTGIDGVVGPGMLPEDTIRFQLREPQAGEVQSVFPMVDQGGVDARWGERFAAVPFGQRTLRVRFEPHRPDSVATAQAGALFAARNRGFFNGPPREVHIAFGINRPVRSLRLQEPLVIGSLRLFELGVRTGDFGTAGSIADAPTPVDPNEIVVAGSRRPPRYDQVTLGHDVLSRCSSITFARREKKVFLRCR